MQSKQKVVYIISSMRAGSTLLKALIATRPDCTNLPETPFQNLFQIATDKKIIVLKCPAFYGEYEYPNLPDDSAKKIVLIRHPYQTIRSLQRMNLEVGFDVAHYYKEDFLLEYWYFVYKSIYERINLFDENVLVLKYEDLLTSPLEYTSKVFRFIKSCDVTGTSSYSNPDDYVWKWGSDDGGEKIKTLEIQNLYRKIPIDALSRKINKQNEINELLACYGYS